MKATTRHTLGRWLWLVGIWSVSVLSVFIVSALLKLLIPG
ncbi:DUF2474 family protein [Marinobacter sp. JSM 1782161]|nr:DUF2474 family protein [Marinobacter sp. JSM 1782161]